MRAIIAGSRSIAGIAAIEAVSAAMVAASGAGIEPSAVISGGARGVDTAAERWARALGLPFTEFRPEYRSERDPQAPLRRNQAMVDYAAPDGALVAVWDGYSRGTADIISRAERAGLKVYVHRVTPT